VDFMGPNSQWRWMLGITGVPPMIVGALVYCMPESPRWYMDKRRFSEAFKSLRKLRRSDIQAARDLYLAYKFLEVEQLAQSEKTSWDTFREFFTVRRNRRAAQSAWFCMIMQQLCGGRFFITSIQAWGWPQKLTSGECSQRHCVL
jgi:hypothetical protein